MKYYIFCRNDEKSLGIAKYLESKINGDINEVEPEVVVAVGGDGTILQAFHKYPSSIIFGLHTGHLGFYANYNPDTIEDLIRVLNSGRYSIQYIPLLSCDILKEDGNRIEEVALNEVTLISTVKTLILDVKIDTEYLETFRGTGLCISTSQGSTAYNKSLYGAVVDHDLNVIQLAEIASINSNAYRTLGSSLVLSSKRRIQLESDAPLELSITVDHLCYNLDNFKSIEIFYNNKTMKMGYDKPEGFINRIARTFIDSKN